MPYLGCEGAWSGNFMKDVLIDCKSQTLIAVHTGRNAFYGRIIKDKTVTSAKSDDGGEFKTNPVENVALMGMGIHILHVLLVSENRYVTLEALHQPERWLTL